MRASSIVFLVNADKLDEASGRVCSLSSPKIPDGLFEHCLRAKGLYAKRILKLLMRLGQIGDELVNTGEQEQEIGSLQVPRMRRFRASSRKSAAMT